MCQALEELFQDGVNQGIEQGIRALVLDYKEDGFSKEKIVEKLVKIYSLTPEKAEAYLTE